MINIDLPQLPPFWERLDEQAAAWCADELRREVSRGHELYKKNVQALVRHFDDVIFSVDGGKKPFAMVHLTQRRADRPPWPATDWYDDVESWLANEKEDAELVASLLAKEKEEEAKKDGIST